MPDYTASTNRMMLNNELERMWKEVVVAEINPETPKYMSKCYRFNHLTRQYDVIK
jgi:hypothetical protein